MTLRRSLTAPETRPLRKSLLLHAPLRPEKPKSIES